MDLLHVLTDGIVILFYVWAFAAYITAAIAGIRALKNAYDRPPPRPSRLIGEATRWVLGRPSTSTDLRAQDFIALGVFGAVIACFIAALQLLDFMNNYTWQKLSHAQNFLRILAEVLTGSALIILHYGVSRRFNKGSA